MKARAIFIAAAGLAFFVACQQPESGVSNAQNAPQGLAANAGATITLSLVDAAGVSVGTFNIPTPVSDGNYSVTYQVNGGAAQSVGAVIVATGVASAPTCANGTYALAGGCVTGVNDGAPGVNDGAPSFGVNDGASIPGVNDGAPVPGVND